MRTVSDFYQTFEFENASTGLPATLQRCADREVSYIENCLESGRDVLEIGCGAGRLLSPLSRKMRRVVGIDYSERLVQRAHNSFAATPNTKIYYMDATDLHLSNDTFDYVLCMGATLCNMPNIELQALREMVRVAKPAGQIILSVFSEKAAAAQRESYERLGLTHITERGNATTTAEGMYSRRFTRNDLQELCNDAGLSCEITSICPINHLVVAKRL